MTEEVSHGDAEARRKKWGEMKKLDVRMKGWNYFLKLRVFLSDSCCKVDSLSGRMKIGRFAMTNF